MRWMVGVDVRGTSHGAAAFARALHRDGGDQVFSALHVIEDRTRAIVAEHYPDSLEGLPRELERQLAPLAKGPAFDDLGVITSATAEDGLHEAAASRPCHGLVLGRRAPAGGHPIVRLGRTARRILRHLEWPTIIVPPEYSGEAPLQGPVLLATDLGSASSGAANFANAMAQDLGVDLLVTTVVTVPGELSHYIPGASAYGEKESHLQLVQARLARWIADHDLGDTRSSVVTGSATAKLLEVAGIAGASLVVAGSRRLPATDRIFVSSTASHLAAQSPVPVAVVPPRWRP
ncbi:MAG: universal stress protein [Myxococcota bacterium]